MDFRLNVVAVALLLLFGSSVQANPVGLFDITKYGAKSNSDITQALSNAWKDACGSSGSNEVVVPEGTFELGKIGLLGPCKGPIGLKVQGTLKAPTNPSTLGDGWVTFQQIDHFTLSGGGVFDGQGRVAWSQNDCHKNKNCNKHAVNLRFNFITNSMVRDVTSLDSKQFHVNLLGCENLTFYHLTITAPENSINTDGIHMSHVTGINITDSKIGTGDDCISIGDGSKQLSVTRVTCGPGHGISVGSLGKFAGELPVVGLTVKNCTLRGTTNGVRIKTWPASKSGLVTEMHFEDIIARGISIPSKVKISNVRFKNIRGTSASPVAVNLICSKGIPCESVEVSDIDLTYNGKDGPAKSVCSNVNPKLSGKQNPPACTA